MNDWLSENPDKAWAERVCLLGSAVWILSVVALILSGWLRSWGDAGYLLFSLFAALPVTALPLFFRPRSLPPLASSYFLKLQLFAWILVFFGTYVGTHYFFDLMGMRYAFPTKLVFEAEVVGKSGAHVPLFMYPLTQAYFVTYFTVLVVLDRGLSKKLGLGAPGRAALTFVLSYAIAFAETLFMANDLMTDLFSYQNKERMLFLGSFGYASYFLVGLPMFRGVDEAPAEAGSAPTSVRQVALIALASCMLILLLLEAWAKLIGPL